MPHLGEFASLLVALFWTITALSFSRASRIIGSLQVNWLRLVLAFVFLGILLLFRTGSFFPVENSTTSWLWLSLSGLVGFVIGDFCLFLSYEYISARISMLIMALAPPIAAVTGYFILDEKFTGMNLVGMLITLLGIAFVVLDKPAEDESEAEQPKHTFKSAYSVPGLLFAFGGAAGQGVGLVLSKLGMQSEAGMPQYDPFASTEIRIITGIIGFTLIIVFAGRLGNLKKAIKNRSAMSLVTLGSIFGPFLGVSFSLLAVQYTSTGIASTIMAIVPVLIIPPSIFLFKEKVTKREIIGAVLAVCGVALFFI
ncbi:MAG: DMT family transporter [Bacteroidota bacterium]|nr:DMT family transporter [Bacteroidota bacterium]